MFRGLCLCVFLWNELHDFLETISKFMNILGELNNHIELVGDSLNWNLKKEPAFYSISTSEWVKTFHKKL